MRPPIPAEDQGMAVVAHLSGLLSSTMAGLGFFIPLVLMLVSDSPVVKSVSKQAMILNLVLLITGVFTVLLWLTFVLIPIAFVIGLGAYVVGVGLPIIGAIMAAQGKYFRYPIIGSDPLVRAELE